MKIAVLKEKLDGETRVAISPEVGKKLVNLGFEVSLERGAGNGSSFTDTAYKEAGVKIVNDPPNALKGAGVVLKVRGPDLAEISEIPRNTIVIANCNALSNLKYLEAMAKAGITAFAIELMPRITRAQSMDILSSQSNLAGYKAILDAAGELGRAFPMMMTAAGTVAPAKVFIMGVGVAGLQAIATAKRMGAIVTATDVRPATKEQVESLGGKFLEVDTDMEKEAQTEGGYAKEMPPEYFEKQKNVVSEHIKTQDVVLTTALIPGRVAPTLVTKKMVETMREGSVVVDLAVEAGGNCELSKANQVFRTGNGVTIIGHRNFPGRIAEDASNLFARNLLNFLSPHISSEKNELVIDWEDEIIKGTLVTKGGKVVNEMILGMIKSKRSEKKNTKKAKDKD